LISETVSTEIRLQALLQWAEQHPGPNVLVALYPTAEIEVTTEEE
jgi:hypothetical protein